MDRRDAESFGRSFSEISRIKDLLPSAKSHDHRNDLLVELQEHYGTVIFFDPLLSLERKFEVELWNIVFKEPISACFEGVSCASLLKRFPNLSTFCLVLCVQLQYNTFLSFISLLYFVF